MDVNAVIIDKTKFDLLELGQAIISLDRIDDVTVEQFWNVTRDGKVLLKFVV